MRGTVDVAGADQWQCGKRDLGKAGISARRGVDAIYIRRQVYIHPGINRSLLLYVWMQFTVMRSLYWMTGTAVLVQLLACHCGASHECIHDKVCASDFLVHTGL